MMVSVIYLSIIKGFACIMDDIRFVIFPLF